MKVFLLKMVASIALKNAIGYAYKASILIIAALKGVLEQGDISDAQRLNLQSVLVAVSAVSDFLGKLTVLFGVAPSIFAARGALPLSTSLSDVIQRLNHVSGQL